jgi:hypothetical protein
MAKLHGAALAAWKRKHPALVRKWKKPRTKRASSKKRRARRATATPKRKRRSTMAKRRKGGSRRSRRGAGSALFNRKNLIITGTALGLGALAHKAARGEADFWKDMPTITPIGRHGTVAAVAGGLYAFGVARRFMGPVAIGAAALALFNIGRRGGLYDSAALDGDILGNGGVEVLEGDVSDVALDAQYVEQPAA